MRLEEQEGATLLTYGVEASVGGKLALGARLLDSTAKKLAGEFFARLGDAVAPGKELDACTEDTKRSG